MDPKLVVALDIGSTYSGYAWQWRGEFEANPSNIGIPRWTGELPKTSTAILFSNLKERTVRSFGLTAENEYGKHAGKREYSDWRLFKNFKMILYSEQFNQNILAEDVEGQEHVKLKDVMTEFIKQLKKHFFETLDKKGKCLNDNEIRWVVTVPAIWNDAAKDLMRTCAEESGISPPNLQLALEPDAAAVYCLHISNEERESMDGLCYIGDSFVLADLGGGTVDITAQVVDVDGTLKHLSAADGNNIGGQDINNAFFLACKDEFPGSSWYEAWNSLSQEERFQSHREFENHFEIEKMKIGQTATTEEEWLNIQLPYSVAFKCSTGEIKLKQDSEIFRINMGRFEFKPQFVREQLFETTVSRIFGTLEEFMKQAKVSDVNKVVLVGGMSESRIVVDKLKMRFKKAFPERRIKVVSPMKPSHAVLTGAVINGHEPEIFKTKISRYTYGISGLVPFVEGVHSKNKKVTIEGKSYCKQIFDIHLKKGQEVRINERLKINTYDPVSTQQRDMQIEMFVSSETPMYVDDVNCKHMATVTVQLPQGSKGQVELSLIYCGNEIRYEAFEKQTGKPYRTNIRFQSIPSFKEQKPCTVL